MSEERWGEINWLVELVAHAQVSKCERQVIERKVKCSIVHKKIGVVQEKARYLSCSFSFQMDAMSCSFPKSEVGE